MSEIINKDLQLGYDRYKKAYEIADKQYQDLLSEAMELKDRADKDRDFLKEIRIAFKGFDFGDSIGLENLINTKLDKYLEQRDE